MDEPFGALDPGTRERMQVFLLTLWEERKKTILFVTHNLSEALALGTRLIVLSPRLGSIKREFSINLPRPRDVESPQITVIKRQILKELEEEFQFVRRENTVR